MKYFLLPILFCFATRITNAQAQPTKIDHIAICVVNLDSSVAFYQQFFKMDTLKVPFANVPVKWFRMSDSVQLHIVKGLDKPLVLPPFSHFCVRIPDFDAFLLLLKSNHLTWYNGLGEPNKLTVRGDGIKQALIKDPSGYWIEVSNAK